MNFAELNLKPGDILIAHCGGILTPQDRKLIAADIKAAGVDNTVLVMQAEPVFEVMRASN